LLRRTLLAKSSVGGQKGWMQWPAGKVPPAQAGP
jgi:hypothetical protein